MGIVGTILGGLGGLLGGAFGGAGSDPKYARVGLDEKGQTAAQGLLKRSQETPEQFGARNLEGVEVDPTRANAERAGAMGRNMSALGMSNATEQAEAINKKIGQKYASQLAEVGRDARLKGINQSFNAKQAQEKAQLAQDQVNQQQDLIERQAFEEAEANRNAVFSQVLGGLGGFAVNAAFDVSRMMKPTKKQQEGIDESLLGKAAQGGLKNIFGG